MLQTYSLTSFIRSSDVPFHFATLHSTSLFPLYFIRCAYKFSAPRTRVAPSLHSALTSHIPEAFRPAFLRATRLCSFNLQPLPFLCGTKRFTHALAVRFIPFSRYPCLSSAHKFGMLHFFCGSFTPSEIQTAEYNNGIYSNQKIKEKAKIGGLQHGNAE